MQFKLRLFVIPLTGPKTFLLKNTKRGPFESPVCLSRPRVFHGARKTPDEPQKAETASSTTSDEVPARVTCFAYERRTFWALPADTFGGKASM